MIPETSVNWKAFEYKFSDNPQRTCAIWMTIIMHCWLFIC